MQEVVSLAPVGTLFSFFFFVIILKVTGPRFTEIQFNVLNSILLLLVLLSLLLLLRMTNEQFNDLK